MLYGLQVRVGMSLLSHCLLASASMWEIRFAERMWDKWTWGARRLKVAMSNCEERCRS